MPSVPIDRLFYIATHPRPIHREPEVVVPQSRAPLDPASLFRPDEPGTHRRNILELGSGWGEFAARWLDEHRDDNYVAFEIKNDRIRRTLKRVRKLDGAHLRMVPVNLNWFLEDILPPHSFDWVIVNFPDPWPKRRHWKHRLVQPQFPGRVAQLLRPGGLVYLATDYGPYARRMLRIFRDAPDFAPVFTEDGGRDFRRSRPADVPPTRFEEITRDQEGRTAYFTRWRLIAS